MTTEANVYVPFDTPGGPPAGMRSLDLKLLDAPPEPPTYLVDGLLERQGVAILSGDAGSAKSLIAQALAAAVVRGEPWLGRGCARGRVLYVDEENPRRIVIDRLRGLGLRSHDDGLAYYSRQGVALGSGDWTAEIRDAVRRHEADLVIIDTVSAACAVEVIDNSAVVRLYQEVLRPLAVDFDLSLVMLHHERKPQQGGQRNAGMAMMGARQWAGQADLHLALEKAHKDRYHESAERPDGQWDAYRYRLETPKRRDGGNGKGVEEVEVSSIRSPAGALQWLRVQSTGTAASRPNVNRDDEIGGRVLAFLTAQQGSARRADIAAHIGVERNDGRLERALSALQDDGSVVKPARGMYAHATP